MSKPMQTPGQLQKIRPIRLNKQLSLYCLWQERLDKNLQKGALMKKVLCLVLLLIGTGIVWSRDLAISSKDPYANTHNKAANFTRGTPLVAMPTQWKYNEIWNTGPVGSRDFYWREFGVNMRVKGETSVIYKASKENGLYNRMIPGRLDNSQMHKFDPAILKEQNENVQTVFKSYHKNQWPFTTISYTMSMGKMPNKAAFKAMGDLWLGDGMGESPVYRFKSVFNFLKKGEFGKGSSADHYEKHNKDWWPNYMNGKLIPALKKSLPQIFDKNFKYKQKFPWTHKEARILADNFMQTYFEDIKRVNNFTTFLSPYYIAQMPDNKCVTLGGSTARKIAHGRGIMRTAGGGKFFNVRCPAEESRRYGGRGLDNVVFLTGQGEDHGYPLEHLRANMWRPFLAGANMMYYHGGMKHFLNDLEGDGTFALTPLGETAVDIMDFAQTLSDRGVAASGVGLLLDYSRQMTTKDRFHSSSYTDLNLKHGDRGTMEANIIRHIFPVHRHNRDASAYKLMAAPYGEIFDVLSPNRYGTQVNPKILANYKVLFGLGGLEIDKQYASVLKAYVQKGGTLVLNVADLGKHMAPSFFGVAFSGGWAKGNKVTSNEGKSFDEATFSYKPLELKGARTLYSVNGKPLVTRFKVGKGQAILVGSRNMIQDKSIPITLSGVYKIDNKPLLNYVPDFMDRLTTGIMPIELKCAPEDRRDLTWWVHKRKDDWLVFVMNYNHEKEYIIQGSYSTNIISSHEYKSASFELICNVPISHVEEIYGNRHIYIDTTKGKSIIKDNARFGDVRVYLCSAKPIKRALTRFVNYAQGKPVEANSTMRRFSHNPKKAPETNRRAPENAVDGNWDNWQFWASGRFGVGEKSPLEKYSKAISRYIMPSWLKVDLTQVRTIDHMKVLFHRSQAKDDVNMNPRIIQYRVELSQDGSTWTTVIDETKNMQRLRARPVEKWFKPVKARYARLTVSKNTAYRGAQVVEFAVYGKDTETYTPEKISPWGPFRAYLPNFVQNWKKTKQKFLADMKPVIGPNGKPARQSTYKTASIRTVYDSKTGGHVYQKVLSVRAPHRIAYTIPARSHYFVAVAGFENPKDSYAGVKYKILVDGQERYNSKPYWGHKALPISIKIDGGKKLEIVLEDLEDGSEKAMAFLAEARFLIK